MYHIQKGCLPYFLGTLARLFAVCLGLFIIFGTYNHWLELKELNSIEVANKSIISDLIFSLFVACLFYPFAYIMGGIFPTIRIKPQGISYRHMVIGGGTIKWDEIEEITFLSKNKQNIGVFIKRKGWFLFNGLWLFSLIGLLFSNQIVPILVFSQGLKDRDLLIKDISNYIDNSLIRLDI